MATTVQQVIRPFFLVFSIICLSIHFQEKVYLSIIYNLAIWIGYTCLYYYIVAAFKVENLFLELNDMTDVIINIISCVTSVILIICYDKRFRRFMKRLDAVDDTLAELGTLKMYHKLQTLVKRIIIMCFICSFFGDAVDMKWWRDRQLLVHDYTFNYKSHTSCHYDRKCVIFYFVVVRVLLKIFIHRYIGTRFEKINEHMRYLLIKKEHDLRCTWRRSEAVNCRYMIRTDNYKCILWTLMHLHLELCRLSRELNAIFGIQLTLETMGFVMVLTQIIVYLFIKIPPQTDFINIIGLQYWILLYIVRLFFLNYLCEIVNAKAKKIEIIHQLTHFLRYADIRNEIHQFSLQVLHHPLKFTGLGLFEFGYAFLKHMFSTVITFVIMGIQS